MLSQTAEKAINAYGGAELWQSHKYIEATVSVKGLAFTLKRRPFFNHAKIKMEIARPFSKLTPIGKDLNVVGVLDGNTVRLENLAGTVISERKNARDYFPYGRRLFYWDDLDMAYFANYAFWNYFTLPNLLLSKEIQWIEKKEGLLEATFPDSIPTHSRIQEFYFDTDTGLLIQHNYTAEIISKLAKAAHVLTNHETHHGFTYSTKRIVTPKGKSGKALNKPVLIDISVLSFQLTNE